jgi:hypothetical protein
VLDYWKIWINDKEQIEKVLNNQNISKEFTSNERGELIGITGRFKEWTIETLSPVRLQITGSIHKWHNGGTNENDFSFTDAIAAITAFSKEFDLNTTLAYIKNLEFAVNLQIELNASEVMDQIICFNNLQPIRPYRRRPDCFFMEFGFEEYYIKVYDKGKQYKPFLPDVPNTLRLEVKAMKNRLLPNVTTLDDLLHIETLQVLGVKLATFLKGLVFDDDTINLKHLKKNDRKLYTELSNPREWTRFRGNSTSTIRKKITRFKELIERHGNRKIYSTITQAINDKLRHLSGGSSFPAFHT